MPHPEQDAGEGGGEDASSAYEDFKRVFDLFASAEEVTGAAPAAEAGEGGEPDEASDAEPAKEEGKVVR